MDNIEERLTAIRIAMLDGSIDSDVVGLAIHYLRGKFQDGYKYGGAVWVPVKNGKAVKSWKMRVSLWKTDAEGTLEMIHRDL